MTDEIKISVITIVYNGESYVERTIKSVIYQTYKNIEYILIDGASTDGTMKIVECNREYFHTIITEPDKGIYNAMNKGLRLASGDYVIFMNAAMGLSISIRAVMFKLKTAMFTTMVPVRDRALPYLFSAHIILTGS